MGERIGDWESNIVELEPTRLVQSVPARLTPDGRIGDCYRTAIACLLGAPYPSCVPHFVEQAIEATGFDVKDWGDRRLARVWLRGIGLDLMHVRREFARDSGHLYLAAVNSRKGDWSHIVVCRGDEVWWDPSGTDAGYTLADLRHPDDAVEVLCEPYDPDPDEMVRRWTERVGGTV